MSIDFQCPHCGARTAVDERYAGQSGPCATCGQTILVPAPPGMVVAAPASRSGAAVWVMVLVVMLVVALSCGGLLLALLLPAVQSAREAARRAPCMNNMKQIEFAIVQYEEVYKAFPAAAGPREPGGPPVSWRVEILPYLERSDLHQAYDATEAWDGPNNRWLAQTDMVLYHCPSDVSPATDTSYVALVGSDAALEADRRTTSNDISDGLSNTIRTVEMHSSGIAWPEPRDLEADRMPMAINHPGGIVSSHRGGANVSFCDGAVRFLDNSIDPAVLRALTTRDGGEQVPVGF